ncbi:unnamed protein product, partial [Linum tenue]
KGSTLWNTSSPSPNCYYNPNNDQLCARCGKDQEKRQRDNHRSFIRARASHSHGTRANKGMACDHGLHKLSQGGEAAKSSGIPKQNYTVLHLDLASLDSVKQFAENVRRLEKPNDVLVCNVVVYLPTNKEPTYTADRFELSVGTNHLGHFLLARLLLDDMKQSDYPSKCLIIVDSITGNTNTLARNVPPKANLGDLRGLVGGLNRVNTSSMINRGEFDGAKVYKDSKVCNMLTMQEFHRRYHEETGVTFSSLYPGCIAETGLLREHVPLFRLLFPPFQKYITKGYVSEEEAGKRLAQVWFLERNLSGFLSFSN